MIIILIVTHVFCIFPNIYFRKDQEISLYPTVGEFYEYYLDNLLEDSQQMCKMYPQVPNVQVINYCEEIYNTQGNQFISMSSNYTHFGTLSNENEVIIYEWKNQMIQQVGQSVTIDSSFHCFNINLSLNFSIIVDCYQNNDSFLIQLMDGQSNITYSIQSPIPTSTKIQSIINGTNAFIVYAQYFDNYSILTLFSSQFYNLSSLNNQFIDFDIPITISPNIYAITSKEIYQLSITPDSQFYIKYNFSQDYMSNFTTINVYYDFQTYSQCDQISVSQWYSDSDNCMVSLQGCENNIILNKLNCEFTSTSIQKILQNNQFIIYQFMNSIVIFENQSGESFKYTLDNQHNSLIYLNFDNELFSFNQEIIVYKIQILSLQVNLTNQEIAGNNYTSSLICQGIEYHKTVTQNKFYLQVLPQNDTNIYVIFNQDFPQYQISLNTTFINQFFSFSGQLLNYEPNQNEAYYNVIQITFYNVGKTKQNYQFVQFLSLNYFQDQDGKQYLIGYYNQSLEILFCIYNYQNKSYKFTLLISINTFVKANSLQVAYSMYPEMIIIGLSTNYTIYLFLYNSYNNSIVSQSDYTFEQQFSDFVVTYNSIIILIPKKKIHIMTFNFTNTFTLNQQTINKYFNNIQFNPIQIVVNTQSQSSLLYINNINEIIIISIDQNSLPIPISLIQVNFTIKQINLVNQQLILSYLCNNIQNICFQVWNVQNLPKYYYVKNLYNVNFDNNIIIQSDNLFFYVTFSNYTVYVYNPSLPYHMSLYYKLELTSKIQCSQKISLSESYFDETSIIISNNTLYLLFGIQSVKLNYQFYNQDLNYSISYPQFIYNYTVTSALNDTAFQQIPNQSITLYSNFTVIQNQTNLSLNLSQFQIIYQKWQFAYPMNLILDRQVEYCNVSYNLSCYFNYFWNESQFSNNQNFSLITSINNEYFALQTNSSIQTVNSDLTYIFNFNYSNLNLNECLKSTSYNYTLFSICQNSTSQYILNFTLDSSGNITANETTQLPQKFYDISKISSIFNQIFILGSLQNSYQQQLYNGIKLFYFIGLTHLTIPYIIQVPVKISLLLQYLKSRKIVNQNKYSFFISNLIEYTIQLCQLRIKDTNFLILMFLIFSFVINKKFVLKHKNHI